MSIATFKPNKSGFAEMARGAEIRAAVLAEAAKAQAVAESFAAEHVHSGEYGVSFQTRSETQVFAGHARAIGILENTSPHAAAVEWANAQDPTAYRILGRTLAALRDG